MSKFNWKIKFSELDAPLRTGLLKAGIAVASQAADYAPIKSGRLKGSITWAMQDNSGDVIEPATSEDKITSPKSDFTVHVGTGVIYAPDQEYGTRRFHAQPYLVPAFLSKMDAIKKMIAEEYKKYTK